jgi:hypothetical protein
MDTKKKPIVKSKIAEPKKVSAKVDDFGLIGWFGGSNCRVGHEAFLSAGKKVAPERRRSHLRT